jgi:hypothetical protein
MSARAKARGAAGARYHDGTNPDDAPFGLAHKGHTQHYCGGACRCSCGAILGVASIVIDLDYLPEPCPICGNPT